MKQIIVRTTVAGFAAAALIGSVAACSSNESPTEETPASASSSAVSSSAPSSAQASAADSPAAEAPDAYTQCLTDHGMPAPPGGFGHHPPGPPPMDGAPPPPPPGVDQDAWDAAQQACATLAPAPPQSPPQ